ncbi:hypothetical protein KA082_01200 [Candidatus Woesebacteria bacterium]|nr:hypothetical protein [Candidatus Woesebacteria bacterium]
MSIRITEQIPVTLPPQAADLARRSESVTSLTDPQIINVLVPDPTTRELCAVPAGKFWEETAQVEPEAIRPLLNKDGSWKFSLPQEELLEKLRDAGNIEQFIDFFYPKIWPVYGPVQQFLDATAYTTHGFNGHEYDRHIGTLLILARIILAALSHVSLLEQKQFLMSILWHDAGNAYSRALHSAISVQLFVLTYGEAVLKMPEMQPMLVAILLHDEKFNMPVIEHILEEAQKKYSEEHNEGTISFSRFFLTQYAQEVPLVASLLQLVDKSDTGRSRVLNSRGFTGYDEDRFNADIYFFLDAVFNVSPTEYGLNKQKDTFIYPLHFSIRPDKIILTPDHPIVYQKTRRPDRKEISIPQTIRTVFKEQNISYFTQSLELFYKKYGDRLALVVLNAFRVYDTINTVQITLTDTDLDRFNSPHAQYLKNQPVVLEFRRDTLIEDLQRNLQRFIPKA